MAVVLVDVWRVTLALRARDTVDALMDVAVMVHVEVVRKRSVRKRACVMLVGWVQGVHSNVQ